MSLVAFPKQAALAYFAGPLSWTDALREEFVRRLIEVQTYRYPPLLTR